MIAPFPLLDIYSKSCNYLRNEKTLRDTRETFKNFFEKMVTK